MRICARANGDDLRVRRELGQVVEHKAVAGDALFRERAFHLDVGGIERVGFEEASPGHSTQKLQEGGGSGRGNASAPRRILRDGLCRSASRATRIGCIYPRLTGSRCGRRGIFRLR